MRQRLLILIAFDLYFAASIFAQASNIQKGLELFQRGEYEAALHDFEQARMAQQGNPALENAIGLTDTKLGRLHEADLHYEAAIRLNPNLPAPYKNLGFNYLNAKRYDAAAKELGTALRLDSTDPFAHYYLGMVFLATARDREAVEQLRRVPSLLDNDPGTSFQYAMATLRLGQTAEAEDTLAKLERHAPLSLRQQYQLAVLFSEKRMYPEALSRFERLAKANPLSSATQWDLSIAYLNAHKPLEAIQVLDDLRAQHPEDARTLGLLGLAYEGAQKPLQALDAYRRALEAEPKNPDRYLDYTRLLMDANRLEEAARLVTQGLRVAAEKYPLYVRLGSIQLLQGNVAGARHWFGEAVALHPEVPLGYVALAQSFLKEGADTQAAKVLSEARQKLAPDFMLDYFYGLTLVRLQRNADAEPVLESSVSLDPTAPEPYYELGRAYLNMGRIDRARAEFERVIQLAPQHANAHYQLSRIYAKLGDTKKARAMAEETKRLKQSQLEQAIDVQRTRLNRFRPVQAAQ